MNKLILIFCQAEDHDSLVSVAKSDTLMLKPYVCDIPSSPGKIEDLAKLFSFYPYVVRKAKGFMREIKRKHAK